MDISTVYDGDNLKAADLNGHEPTVTIENVQVKEFEKDGKTSRKLILSFEGKKKKLVCNATNARRIAHFYGNETNGWLKKEITLYTEMVDFGGKLTEGIRVKVMKKHTPPQTAPQRMTQLEDDQRNAAMDDVIPF